jgi:hypothetical protein
MPNLIPDWMDWMRPAGRLIWFSLLLIVGLLIVGALIAKPIAKRPFPLWVGVALFPVVAVITWIVAALAGLASEGLQVLVVWVGLGALVALALFLCATREPGVRDYTWAEVFLGATGVFALMTFAYGNVPHEWITFSDSYLLWSTDKNLFSSRELFSIGSFTVFFPPFNMSMQALRDIIVVLMYGALITLNTVLFVLWQKRNAVPAERAEAAPKVKRFSRFGRPVKARA